ncbi:hypothetical protein, partial [Synechococcus sp. R8-2]|uniref:hypothetical protein n=1 Tax=Synechococcus sp. R8-2 TaxID=2291959 RepID=UPI0039C03EBB
VAGRSPCHRLHGLTHRSSGTESLEHLLEYRHWAALAFVNSPVGLPTEAYLGWSPLVMGASLENGRAAFPLAEVLVEWTSAKGAGLVLLALVVVLLAQFFPPLLPQESPLPPIESEKTKCRIPEGGSLLPGQALPWFLHNWLGIPDP